MAQIDIPQVEDPIEKLLRGSRPDTKKTPKLGYDVPTQPAWYEKAYGILKDMALDPNNLGMAGIIKFPDAQRIITEIMSQKFPDGIAAKRLQQNPFGTQIEDRTGTVRELWKTPEIANIPYPGRFSESELARVLGDPLSEAGFHGFFTPKGKGVGTSTHNTHREALDELLGYRSPDSGTGNSYVNDLFYDNPRNKGHVYDTSEMLDDTNLVRVFRSNPRMQQPSYMEIPPNVTEDQLGAIMGKFGKPRDASMGIAIPEEIKMKFQQEGPRNIHMRHYIDQMYDTPGQADDQVRSILGRYAEDLGRYFR
jgi:hypothetical protein